MDTDPLWHQSGVNQKGEPFIQIIHGERVIGQMTPADAREHALAILMAAEASEQDAFMMSFMQEKIGLDFNRAGQVLMDYRGWRVKTTGKKGGPTDRRDWVMPPDKGGDG